MAADPRRDDTDPSPHSADPVERVAHAVNATTQRWRARRDVDIAVGPEASGRPTRRAAWRWVVVQAAHCPTLICSPAALMLVAVSLGCAGAGALAGTWWLAAAGVFAAVVQTLAALDGAAARFRRTFDGLAAAGEVLGLAGEAMRWAPKVMRTDAAAEVMANSVRAAVLRIGAADTCTLMRAWGRSGVLLDPRCLVRAADALDTVDVTCGPAAREAFLAALRFNPMLRHDPSAAAWALAATCDDDAFAVALHGVRFDT